MGTAMLFYRKKLRKTRGPELNHRPSVSKKKKKNHGVEI